MSSFYNSINGTLQEKKWAYAMNDNRRKMQIISEHRKKCLQPLQ